MPIMGLIFPMVSEIITKKEQEKLNTLAGFFYSYFSIFALVLSVFLMVLGPEIALILFGERFVLSGELFSAGALFTVFMVLSSFNFSVLAGMGKIKERVKIMALAVVFLFFGGGIGIKLGGLYGMVFAYSIAYFLLWLLSYLLMKKKMNIRIQGKLVLKNLLILAVLGIALYCFKKGVFIFEDGERYANALRVIAF